MKPTCLTILLLTFFVVEIHSLPVLSTVWELLGGEDSQIKVNLTLTGTIEKVHKFYGSDAREPAVSLKLEEDQTTQTIQPDANEHMLMHKETSPDHELSTYHTTSSETSGFETTQQATTPNGEPTATTTIPYEKATEQATSPYSEPTETTTRPYGRAYDDSSDSSEETNGHTATTTFPYEETTEQTTTPYEETTTSPYDRVYDDSSDSSNWGTTTQKPIKHECPTAFKLIYGSCFQVVPELATGYESAGRCKQYARENNLPEENVGLGMILNDEQNTAVADMAMEKELIKDLTKYFSIANMWVGVWRPATEIDGNWKYMRNNQSVTYTNFPMGIYRLSDPHNSCVYQFLLPYQPGKDVGKWDDVPCFSQKVAVLCEYEDTSYFRNSSV